MGSKRIRVVAVEVSPCKWQVEARQGPVMVAILEGVFSGARYMAACAASYWVGWLRVNGYSVSGSGSVSPLQRGGV